MKQGTGPLRKSVGLTNPLFKSAERWRDNIKINRIRNESKDLKTDTEETQSILRADINGLYSTKLKPLKVMGNFLET